MEIQEAILLQMNPQSQTLNGTARGTRRESDSGLTMAAGASMWSKMIRNLPCLAYLKTLILALGFGLFMCTMYVISSLLGFWSGVWCGVALTLAVEGIFLYIILGMRGVQVDPSSLALSPLMANDIPQTIQNNGFQDVAGLNMIVTVFWPCIAKSCGARIKEIVQEILDGHAVDASKHICLSAMAYLKFGRAIDQVLCAAKKKVQDKLESSLSRLATKRVILKEMDFGTKPPEITAFRCESGVDELIFEIKFLWESEGARSRLSIDICGHQDIIQVKNVRLQGTVKIALKPLREEIPGFGALVVSLKEAPLVDFDLKVLDDWIGDSSHMKKSIQEFIESALTESFVWPSRFVLPLIPGEDFSFLESRAVGELRVRLIKAEDIVHTHHIGKVRHFVEIFVRQSKVKRSTSKKSSEPAVWDETMTVEVEDLETQTLTLRLSRESRVKVRPDTFIGSRKLAIEQFQPGETKEMSYDLKDPDSETNEIRGKLFLAITYHPFHVGAGPVPDNV